MKVLMISNFKLRSISAALLLSLMLGLFGNGAEVFAHGGEDHGDEKPQTATTATGTVSRTARLGDFEIMLKHALLEPDTATTGRLFITRFATNEPVDDANPALEVESASGAVTEISIEKTDAAGSYTVKIPALPEGAYTMRTKATVGGKTNTATFSGVEVAHQETAATEGGAGGSSWLQTALTAILFLIASALFAGLIYLAVRVIKNKPVGEEETTTSTAAAVSA